MVNESNQAPIAVIPPRLMAGSAEFLSLESTLEQLPLYSFAVDDSCLVMHIAPFWEQDGLLPGVMVMAGDSLRGLISRRQFLEYLLLPQGWDLFWQQPIGLLLSYIRRPYLCLEGKTPILQAAHQALRRSRQEQFEPIVVKLSDSSHQILDFSQLNLAAWQLRGIETQVRYERIHAQMLQSEKMASLGRLVDGLAHEILDPVGFIWGNLSHVAEYSRDLLKVLALYEQNLEAVSPELVDLQEDVDLEFLRDDLPRAIESIQAGAERLKKLSTSLQNFCHIDEVYPKPADIHACLDSIILLLKSRLHTEIKITTNYGNLPPITCYIGQLNQVFMNILTNAVDVLLNQAIGQKLAEELNQVELLPSDANGTPVSASHLVRASKPTITITTEVISSPSANVGLNQHRWVMITIADNGPGMSPEVIQQILDSFSVKQRTAKETSLAVSYQTITAKHGGKLNVRSQLGLGTEFEILLPLS